MKIYRTFSNGNQVVSDLKTEAREQHSVSGLTMRVVIRGTETYKLDNREIRIIPGYFVMFREGVSFTRIVDSLEPVQTLAISFDSGFVKDFTRRQSSRDHHLKDPDRRAGTWSASMDLTEAVLPLIDDFHYTVRNLCRTVDDDRIEHSLLNEYLYHSLLGYSKVFRLEIENRADRLKIRRPDARLETFRRVQLARDFLVSNFDRRVGITEVAEASFLSVNHLLRNFHDAFQTSPYQYLIRIRLQYSRRLLTRTQLQIADIAALAGFDSDSTFITVFKKAFGITPLQFRKVIEARALK